jgi:hypothetical protein
MHGGRHPTGSELQFIMEQLAALPTGHGFSKMGDGNPVARIRATYDNVEFDAGVQGV